jgi:hypothetical protein
MKNEYEVRGDITAIIINSPKYGRFEALISTKKIAIASEFEGNWGIHKDGNSYYVRGNTVQSGKRKTIFLHRVVTSCPDGFVVDHFNHETLDNTDQNLRVVTHAENLQNQKGYQRNGSSGIRGVCWDKKSKKWRSSMRINGKLIYLGLFTDIYEAERTVIKARTIYMPFSKEALA